MRKEVQIEVTSVQYIYDKEAENDWKLFYFNLIKKDLNSILVGDEKNEKDCDLCSSLFEREHAKDIN